jgi:hypothetical protein
MRWSRAALLVFGAGLLLGLAVVSAELRGLARVASWTMALGLAALPVAIVADLRRREPASKPRARKRRGSAPAKPAGRTARRTPQQRRRVRRGPRGNVPK